MADEPRADGTGSVRQQSDGRFEGQYFDRNGKRRSVYGKARRDVETKLRQAITAIERGESSASQRLTVSTYLSDRLDSVAQPKLRPKTFVSYRQTIQQHIVPALGNIKLAHLTPVDIPEIPQRQALLRAEQANRLLSSSNPAECPQRRDQVRISVPQPSSPHVIPISYADD